MREQDDGARGAIPLTFRDPEAEAAAAWPILPGQKRDIWRRLLNRRRETLRDILLSILLVVLALLCR